MERKKTDFTQLPSLKSFFSVIISPSHCQFGFKFLSHPFPIRWILSTLCAHVQASACSTHQQLQVPSSEWFNVISGPRNLTGSDPYHVLRSLPKHTQNTKYQMPSLSRIASFYLWLSRRGRKSNANKQTNNCNKQTSVADNAAISIIFR